MENHYKDGKRHGPVNGWHNNWQKMVEAAFKDAEKILEKRLDVDGNQIYPKP